MGKIKDYAVQVTDEIIELTGTEITDELQEVINEKVVDFHFIGKTVEESAILFIQLLNLKVKQDGIQ